MLIRFYLLIVSTKKVCDDKNGPTSTDDVSTRPKHVHHHFLRNMFSRDGQSLY
jgi:hypothetical protein